MPLLRSGIRAVEAIRIFVRPAQRPIMLLLGAIGIAVTLPTVVITLLSLAVGQFGDRMPDGNRINYIIATERLKKLNDALQRYRVDCGRYPTPDEGLAALVLDYRTRGWRGPYLDEVPVDAWRRPYIYDHGTDPPKIMSYGADGAPGGKLFNADLSNLTLSQPIPESPYEVGRHLIDIAIWIAALFVFCASVYALARFSQLR